MTAAIAIGALATLAALWLIYRIDREERDLLPPPDPKCRRDGTQSVP